MTLNQIARSLHIPLPVLLTGRTGKPDLKLVRPTPKPGPPPETGK